MIRNNMFTLKVGLGLAFVLIVFSAAFGMGAATYIVAKNHFRAQLLTKIQHLAGTAAALIDQETHAKILVPDDEATENYKSIKSWLQKFKNTNPEIKFIYTMRLTEKGKEFVVDAEENEEEMSHVGDIYEEEIDTLNAAFKNPGEILVESEFSTDEWGTTQSGFAPIYNKDGSFWGILGVDIDANDILKSEAEIQMLIGKCSIVTLFIALIASFFIANGISGSLSKVVDDVRKIQNLELDHGSSAYSAISEISQLNEAIDGMKKALRSFKKFVPSDLVVEMLKSKQEARLETTKKELTLLFTDIADFTTISESLSPDQLSENMAIYLDKIAAVIRKNQGTLDKFIGDAVMAFWGAPQVCQNHAELACKTAIECKHELDQMNEGFKRKGHPIFFTRFGINTGGAIVGNMGTDTRMSFTAIGDSVNLASRTEALNKNYGTEILITQSTYERVKDKFAFRFVDETIVKGKSNALRMYELIGEKDSINPEYQKQIDRHNEAMNQLLDGDIRGALTKLKKLQNDSPALLLTQYTIERLENLLAENQTEYKATVMRTK
jgi:class 3 adenylate cyclase